MKQREKNGGFFSMLLVTLATSGLGNLLSGKSTITAGGGTIRAGKWAIRAGQDF